MWEWSVAKDGLQLFQMISGSTTMKLMLSCYIAKCKEFKKEKKTKPKTVLVYIITIKKRRINKA